MAMCLSELFQLNFSFLRNKTFYNHTTTQQNFSPKKLIPLTNFALLAFFIYLILFRSICYFLNSVEDVWLAQSLQVLNVRYEIEQ